MCVYVCVQASSRALAPILQGNGKSLVGLNNQDAYTEAVHAQQRVRAYMRARVHVHVYLFVCVHVCKAGCRNWSHGMHSERCVCVRMRVCVFVCCVFVWLFAQAMLAYNLTNFVWYVGDRRAIRCITYITREDTSLRNWEKELTILTTWFRATHTLIMYIPHTITLVRAQQSFLTWYWAIPTSITYHTGLYQPP